MIRLRPRRGLRSSVTRAFALGALVLSSVLATGTYFSARHLLLEQRERTALRQAFTDSALVRDSLLTAGTPISDVLGSVSPPAGAAIYVHRDGEWYSSALDSAGPEMTAAVQPVVEEGAAALAWTSATDPPAVVVGVPMPAVNAQYYEVSVAEELDRTLSTLRLALSTGAILTTAAGALLGRAVSRRVLAPLEEVAGTALRVSAGDLTARLDTTDDPDLVALVASFNNMVDALRERIDRDARFAADVSHELRTPVTTLTTSLSLLQQIPDLPARSQRAVRLMADELGRFRHALEDLLALGRLDAGSHEAEPTVTRTRELVVHALLAAGLPTRLLVTDPRGDVDPTIRVDRVQMLRVLTNLFRNAELHGAGLTSVVVLDGGEVVEIRVQDRGPGVPAKDRTRIFERFARAGGQKTGTGSGLGLSIVQRTVRNHGGGVWCTERADGGAEFVVRLPAAREAAP